MTNCYLCNSEISYSNVSKEHIIPNSCGGKLKSTSLLCKTCNNNTGSKYDDVLSKQVSDFVTLLKISKDRGKLHSVKGTLESSGLDYYIKPDGKPILKFPNIEKNEDNSKKEFHITANSEDEARTILMGLKRNNPSLDVEAILKNAMRKIEYLEPLKISVKTGGPEANRAILKIATNFYIYSGGEREHINSIIDLINDETKELKGIVQFYPSELIYNPKESEVSHLIHIKESKEENLLYAYIELFSTIKYLILLNGEYKGEDFNEIYCYDLLENKNINAKPKELTLSEITDALNTDLLKQQKTVETTYSRLLKIIDQIQFKARTDEITQIALENSLKKYPEGIRITEKMLDEFYTELMKELMPFLASRMRK